MNIYIVSYLGVEWNRIDAAFLSRARAEDYAKEKNDNMKKNPSVFDRLSEYVVTKVPVADARLTKTEGV